MRHSLTVRLIVASSMMVLTICLLFLLLIEHHLQTSITEQMGEKALTSAFLIAERPDVTNALLTDAPSRTLQPIAERLRQQTGAAFIVIGNEQGIRYTHPDETKIGLPMIGGDNDAALLNKEAIVSVTTGSLGESIRGKVPILHNDRVIGIVSVGFLTADIDQTIDAAFLEWLKTTLIVATFGIVGAIALSYYVKHQLLGMQPREIAKLYKAYDTILHTTNDGVILTTLTHDVVVCNDRAKALLPMIEQQMSLSTLLPVTLLEKKGFRALEIPLQQQLMIVSKTPLHHNELLGYLYVLREKDEYEVVVNELTNVKQQAQMQRAKTHEFANKLHILLGLLKQGCTNDAIAFIQQEQQLSSSQQHVLSTQPSILIQALLEGKIAEAAEKQIALFVDSDSITDAYNDEQVEAVLTALGNVLQNAIDALHDVDVPQKRIDVVMHEYAHELLIEVHDSGLGISDEQAAHMFTLGYSTKDGYDRGYGLAISAQALHHVGGELLVEESDLGGACFIIILERR